MNETPRSFSPQPVTSLSGSDHSKSQSKPGDKEKVHNNIVAGKGYFLITCTFILQLIKEIITIRNNLPWSGTSVGLMIRRICSIDCRSGDKPAAK